jgi:7SK snRNA methylphosphate capping enzyme
MRFFQRVHSVLDTGGVFVLEPQTWDTYAKAKRMDQVGLFSILCILLH